MEKEIKIEIPEGYEINKEKSTFEKIVFKKKEAIINCWEDLKPVRGYFIGLDSHICYFISDSFSKRNKNIFLNEKYAKSALALAQISQLLPYYDSKVDWNSDTLKYCLINECNKLIMVISQSNHTPLAFNNEEEAERFLNHNEQLVKDYLMID